MTRLRQMLPGPIRRMLSEREAAAYCGAPSVVRWRAECDVRPVKLYGGRDGLRFDLADLDAWLEQKKVGSASSSDVRAMIGKLSNGTGTREGT